MLDKINNNLLDIINRQTDTIVEDFFENYIEVDEIIVNNKRFYIDNKHNIYIQKDKFYEWSGLYKNNILYITD